MKSAFVLDLPSGLQERIICDFCKRLRTKPWGEWDLEMFTPVTFTCAAKCSRCKNAI
jgi:hypothetical protein